MAGEGDPITHLGRWLMTLGAPGGRRGKLCVLIYHRVLPGPDPMCVGEVNQETFRWHVALLARHCRVLPLSEALQGLAAGTLPPRAVAITFDDGYRDNAEVALPILSEYRVPATFFVTTGFVGGGLMWNDRITEFVRCTPQDHLDLRALGLPAFELQTWEQRRYAARELVLSLRRLADQQRSETVQAIIDGGSQMLPDNLMMEPAHVRQLAAAGMEIGAHTVNHPLLSRVDRRQAETEIAESKDFLESLLHQPVALFAYPNGKPGTDYGAEHVAMVKRCGFQGAVSTRWGAARRQDDPFQIPRLRPWQQSPGRFQLELARNTLRQG